MFDGLGSDTEDLAYLPVALPLGDEHEAFELASSERRVRELDRHAPLLQDQGARRLECESSDGLSHQQAGVGEGSSNSHCEAAGTLRLARHVGWDSVAVADAIAPSLDGNVVLGS